MMAVTRRVSHSPWDMPTDGIHRSHDSKLVGVVVVGGATDTPLYITWEWKTIIRVYSEHMKFWVIEALKWNLLSPAPLPRISVWNINSGNRLNERKSAKFNVLWLYLFLLAWFEWFEVEVPLAGQLGPTVAATALFLQFWKDKGRCLCCQDRSQTLTGGLNHTHAARGGGEYK